jgi:hypothetical protein
MHCQRRRVLRIIAASGHQVKGILVGQKRLQFGTEAGLTRE